MLAIAANGYYLAQMNELREIRAIAVWFSEEHSRSRLAGRQTAILKRNYRTPEQKVIGEKRRILAKQSRGLLGSLRHNDTKDRKRFAEYRPRFASRHSIRRSPRLQRGNMTSYSRITKPVCSIFRTSSLTTGPAARLPEPPCSRTTTNAYCGESAGTYPANHA